MQESQGITEEAVVAYDVFDRHGNVQASYSVDLDTLKLKSTAFAMAKQAVSYHVGGSVKERFNTGRHNQVFSNSQLK